MAGLCDESKVWKIYSPLSTGGRNEFWPLYFAMRLRDLAGGFPAGGKKNKLSMIMPRGGKPQWRSAEKTNKDQKHSRISRRIALPRFFLGSHLRRISSGVFQAK